MKRTLAIVLTFLFMLSLMAMNACAPQNKEFVLATTTSVNDSGLMDYLAPYFEKDTGYSWKVISQGSGQAIKTAEAGDADAVLLHSPAAEEQFVADGYGTGRVSIFFNFFNIVGPADDPAGVKGSESASAALVKIAQAQAPFISRGDDSGTHNKGKALWTAADMEPAGDWYISAGQGMGATLTMANEKNAYTLTDLATYLSNKGKLDALTPLLEESSDLKNTYSVMRVNPDKVSVKNAKAGEAFVKWMTSDKAKGLIAEYGKETYGAALFSIIS